MRGVAVRLVRRMPVALLRRPLAAGAAPLDPADRLPDPLIARDIIFKNKMSYLREKLAADGRFRMPFAEFQEWLEANEVPQEEAVPFLKALHTAGLVLYYPYRAPDWIYLRPRAVTRELLHMLDPEGDVASALMRNKTANLEKLEAEYAALTTKKEELDALAEQAGTRWTRIFMGSAVAQIFIFGRLIFWDLSWDVMEPVSYILAFSYIGVGWTFYTLNKQDIAEYGTIAGRYVANKSNQLYEKNGFSITEYEKLGEEITRQKKTLKLYGVDLDKKAYPIELPQSATAAAAASRPADLPVDESSVAGAKV